MHRLLPIALLLLTGCDLDNPFRAHEHLFNVYGTNAIEGNGETQRAERWRDYLLVSESYDQQPPEGVAIALSSPPVRVAPTSGLTLGWEVREIEADFRSRLLAVAGANGQIAVIDLLDPEAPEVVFDQPVLDPDWRAIARAAHHLLIADEDVLHVFDLDAMAATPGDEASWHRIDERFTQIRELAAHDETVAVFGVLDGRATLEVTALTDDVEPLRATHTIDVADAVGEVGVSAGLALDDTVVGLLEDGELSTWDITTPGQAEPGTRAASMLGRIRHIEEGFVYTAAGDDGVDIADVRKPLKPRWVHNFPNDARVLDVAGAGEVVYSVAGLSGVRLFAPRRDWDAYFEDEE